jgi:hypothetical protein
MGEKGALCSICTVSGSCCGFLACRHAWGLHALSVISLLIRDIHGTRGVHVLTNSSPKLGNAVVGIYLIQQFSTCPPRKEQKKNSAD